MRLFLEWLQLLLIFVKPGCVGVDQAMFWDHAGCAMSTWVLIHVRMGAQPGCCSSRVHGLVGVAAAVHDTTMLVGRRPHSWR